MMDHGAGQGDGVPQRLVSLCRTDLLAVCAVSCPPSAVRSAVHSPFQSESGRDRQPDRPHRKTANGLTSLAKKSGKRVSCKSEAVPELHMIPVLCRSSHTEQLKGSDDGYSPLASIKEPRSPQGGGHPPAPPVAGAVSIGRAKWYFIERLPPKIRHEEDALPSCQSGACPMLGVHEPPTDVGDVPSHHSGVCPSSRRRHWNVGVCER